jgi:hypothetical protein
MSKKTILLQLIVSLLAITLSACAASSPPANDTVSATVEASTEAAPTATLPSEAPSAETPTVADPAAASVSYPIVDTGQTACYNNNGGITCPAKDQAFYGQDAQSDGNQPSYTLSADGLTVYDNVTGLTWTQSPDWNGDGDIDSNDKFIFSDFLNYHDTLNAQNYGGCSDWRAPTIKELYSLIDFRGTDPLPEGTNTAGLIPFIDTDYFDFGYGDTAASERIIDAQFWSSTEYVRTTMGGIETTFGVNFADGRIKGYGRTGPDGRELTQYARFVRGNTDYGVNDFTDNGDGTITDNATGLTWSQDDSGTGMNWGDALAWVQQKNDENYLGYSDWRLPNAKELQSIVDYSRSPDTTGSAAIDPVFNATQITNEAGRTDYPFYWTSTSHLHGVEGSAVAAVYVAFGRGLGSMDGVNVIDVHGAGCQRSDPKDGDPSNYPSWGHGPQGDVQRVFNYVRLVRGGTTGDIFIGGEVEPSAGSPATPPGSDLGPEQPAGEPGRRPDLAAAAAQLRVSEEALREALGDPRQGPPDFAAAAQQLGVTEEELIAALGVPPLRQPLQNRP